MQNDPRSSWESSAGPLDVVLDPIVDRVSPIGLFETVVDFLRRKSEVFQDDDVERKIAGVVSAARAKFVGERGKKKTKAGKRGLEDAGKEEKRLKEDNVGNTNQATEDSMEQFEGEN